MLAKIAFAARCARLTLPFLESWAKDQRHREEVLDTLSHAIAFAEAHANLCFSIRHVSPSEPSVAML